MNKNTLLNQWLWKWHVIAGLLTLPFMLLLTLTGIIYMFKDDVNQYLYKDVMFVSANGAPKMSLEQQLKIAQAYNDKKISGLVVAPSDQQATAFKEATKGRAANYVYVDSYRGQVTGTFAQKQTLMYDIRKLHGELLLSKPGTIVVELVASWFVVLILTGLYVWWPKERFTAKGLFAIRFKKGNRVMWRDLHAVFGFWLSVFLLIIIAGAMPWTDVFGSQLKWVQKQTNTGYPIHWRSSKGLTSNMEQLPTSAQRLSIDDILTLPTVVSLSGKLTITLPKDNQGVFTIANRSLFLSDQHVIHLDQYSGQIVKQHTWQDVGILMDLRQVFMRLHQGEYGRLNWYVLIMVSLLFFISTLASVVAYLKRKPANNWAIPKVPARFHVDKMLLCLILFLAILFPLFGLSALLIALGKKVKTLSWRSTHKTGDSYSKEEPLI